MTPRRAVIALLLGLTTLSACSTEGEMRAVDPAGSGEPSTSASPDAAPTPT